MKNKVGVMGSAGEATTSEVSGAALRAKAESLGARWRRRRPGAALDRCLEELKQRTED
jgi:hypothetical protein